MMDITKTELKILIKQFLSASNRMLRAGYEIYSEELFKFVRFLETHELIYDYIKTCGEPEYDVSEAVKEITNSYGSRMFPLGSTDEKEVANVFAVIKYLAENKINGRSFVYFGYSSTRKYQDHVNGFGEKFIWILIMHIEQFLNIKCIQIEGNDEQPSSKFIYIENSNLENIQLNLESDECSQEINEKIVDEEKLQFLIDALLAETDGLDSENKKNVEQCVEKINTIKENNADQGIIKKAIETLKGITGPVEFLAAVTALAQFVMQCINMEG